MIVTGLLVAGCVLVVDDDTAICALLTEYLSEFGYDVISAANGLDGIKQAKLAQPNCILMDLNMPVLDGASAIRQLKRDPATRDIPIYVMSATWNIQRQLDGLPVDGILTKPFDLHAVLHTLLSGHGLSPNVVRPTGGLDQCHLHRLRVRILRRDPVQPE